MVQFGFEGESAVERIAKQIKEFEEFLDTKRLRGGKGSAVINFLLIFLLLYKGRVGLGFL